MPVVQGGVVRLPTLTVARIDQSQRLQLSEEATDLTDAVLQMVPLLLDSPKLVVHSVQIGRHKRSNNRCFLGGKSCLWIYPQC